MVEPAMYFGIGFLVASLFGIVLIALVHGRAVRLTMRRLEAATPLSMAEIQADKDQLRAEFAMSTRRLEMSVDRMKAKTTSQLAELGKKTEAINRLKVDLGEKTATIFALEAREKALKEQLRATEEEYGVKATSLHEAERALHDKEAELARLNADLGEKSVSIDSQRVELISLKTQIDALKFRIEDYEKEVKNTEDRLNRERQELANASKELTAERGKVENLGHRVGQLEQRLAAQTMETEMLHRRAQELETRISDQKQLLSEREHQCDQLRAQIEAARRTESDLRVEIAVSDERHNQSTEHLKAEKTLLEKQLEQANDERIKLKGEIAAMKREAEATWAAERVENALLRERINDVAAEIAQLTVVLEGSNSPIEAILAGEAVSMANGANGPSANGENGVKPLGAGARGNLAERMRALQNRASRLPTAAS